MQFAMQNTPRAATMIVAALVVLGLQGCGGNDDRRIGGNGAAALFDDYSTVLSGGYRSVRTPISDTTHTVNTDCGYIDPVSVDDAEDDIADLGGTVTVANDSRWCGTSPDETRCLLRAGGSFVTDVFYAGTPAEREYAIIIPDDENLTRAYFTLATNGTTATARADIEEYTDSIPSSGNCTPSTPSKVATAINGSWKGYRVTYSRGSKTGTEVEAEMICSAQSCTVASETFGSIPFAAFLPAGSWKATWNNRVAGVSMINAGDALAMYVCPAPLDEVDVVDECVFYGFRRD